MEKKQWVQHISGQGEKWSVYDDMGDCWCTWGTCYKLPKSEYRLCEPPGPKWKPVDNSFVDVKLINADGTIQFGIYRVRMTGIEQLVPE